MLHCSILTVEKNACDSQSFVNGAINLDLEDILGYQLKHDVEEIAKKVCEDDRGSTVDTTFRFPADDAEKRVTSKTVNEAQTSSKIGETTLRQLAGIKNKENQDKPSPNKSVNGKFDDSGSMVLLTTVRATPKKLLQHDSATVLSPVRRSRRLTTSVKKINQNGIASDGLEDLLEETNFTFVSNPALKTIDERSLFVQTNTPIRRSQRLAHRKV